MRFEASDLFTLRNVGSKSGKPEWANQQAYRQHRWKGAPEDLAGPGIYGLFFKGTLFYVGIFAGASADPFRGSVLDRWQKHVTYQLLRAPVISFARSELQRILNEIDGPVRDAIARCLPDGSSTDCAALPAEHPLIGGGTCCTFRKARFAARNWDAIGPESGDQFLQHITFVYERIPGDAATLALLTGADDAQRRKWIKHRWLASRERQLIEVLRPACNSEIAPGSERSDVGIEEFEAELRKALARDSLTAFAPEAAAASGLAPSPHRPTIEADLDPASAVADPAAEAEDAPEDRDPMALAERDTTVEEQLFRRDLPVAIEDLVDEIEQDCPSRFATYFTRTGKGDFRVALQAADGRNERVLLRLHVTRGILHCETLASVEACQALGFDARPLGGKPMNAVFDIDPAEHGASDVFTVAGAAIQALKPSA